MGRQLNLISWNVNGIRACHRKGFLEWFHQASPDIVALQEVRALPEQLSAELRQPEGYHTYWFPAEKKGYSGVALYTKTEPLEVRYGIGVPEFDSEGRTLIAEYPEFTLLNAYFPSGTRSMERVDFKLAFNDAFLEIAEEIRATGKPVIFCGDVNTAHQPIDLTHPKANEKNSGFLPIEREWLDKVFALGYIDTFRHLYPMVTEVYSWWTSRGGAREKNVGWRIDYVIMSENLLPTLREATVLTDVMGSDHCPVGVTLEFESP
ncbi:MAG: exodeoxyribonuclease III [Chloroflexi bacterium]|nr:exodeoxyribonuclease III [Chloroflexota bacterium]